MKKLKSIVSTLTLMVFCFGALVGLSACGKKQTIALSTSANTDINSAVDYLVTNVYDNSTTFGTGTTYSVSEAQEKDSDFVYYVEVATLKNFDEVTKVTVGKQEFASDDTISLSIGNNNFLEDKVWYVEEGKLYVSAVVMSFEFYQNNTITVNSTKATIKNTETLQTLTLSNVAFKNSTNTCERVGTTNEYNLTLNYGNAWLGFYYDGATATDVALTKKVKTKTDGTKTINYGITTTEAADNYPVAFYVGAYKDGEYSDDEKAELNGVKIDYSIYVPSKGLAVTKLNVSATSDAE